MIAFIDYLTIHPGVVALGAVLAFVWATAFAFWAAEREGTGINYGSTGHLTLDETLARFATSIQPTE